MYMMYFYIAPLELTTSGIVFRYLNITPMHHQIPLQGKGSVLSSISSTSLSNTEIPICSLLTPAKNPTVLWREIQQELEFPKHNAYYNNTLRGLLHGFGLQNGVFVGKALINSFCSNNKDNTPITSIIPCHAYTHS